MSTNQKFRASTSTLDNGGLAPWSDLNHDPLILVMMKLGVIDFISFSGVCKPWRSLALYNRKKFMSSKSPMLIWLPEYVGEKDSFFLEDIEGRVFKTNLPDDSGRICVGSTCGNLILFGRSTNDFWLVNPITRHQIHFPNVHFAVDTKPDMGVMAVLVFSPSLSGWVFVILIRTTNKLWVSTAGNGSCDHVPSHYRLLDLQFFKGKIFVINTNFDFYELRLNPQPHLVLLAPKNFEKEYVYWLRFARSGENLFVVDLSTKTVYELDFGKMNGVLGEDAKEKYVFFYSAWGLGAALPPSWAAFRSKQTLSCGNVWGFGYVEAHMWYFPHECLNIDTIDE